MTPKKELSLLKGHIQSDLERSKKHLEFSFEKCKKIIQNQSLSEENLESLESFSSRFARYSDIVVSRYFRALAIELDPAFRGSVIDLLNIAEKNKWIASAKEWTVIRELRNIAAHEYEAEDYVALYKELLKLTPTLLQVSTSL